MIARITAAALALACASTGTAQSPVQRSELHSFRIDTVVTGLEHPWSVAFLPNGDLLVTERAGRLRMIRGGKLLPEPVAGVPEVFAVGQGGLLDVVLHPGFASNRLVYLSYSKPGPRRRSTTAVLRGRLDGHRLADVQEIIEAKAWLRSSAHFGSRLVFDRNGFLFISIGERGEMKLAQDRSDHTGSILRLHDDGRVPRDNPFVGQRRVQPEIYAYGIRSPQGLAIHPATGVLWETEHGPQGGDELNIIKPGANYGWPVVTYGIDYDGSRISKLQRKEGIEDPLKYWVPSIGTSGLAVYNGDKFPRWRGDLFAGGLTGEQLVRLRFDGTRKVADEVVLSRRGRIRDVRSAPDGYLYVLIDAPRAPLLRLVPAQ
jgi:glucose/arabinose dehydrogenase